VIACLRRTINFLIDMEINIDPGSGEIMEDTVGNVCY